MLLNVLMNEFILVLWKRRGWWLLGGFVLVWMAVLWGLLGRQPWRLCVPTASAPRAVFVEMLTLPCRMAGCTGSWEELETDGLSKERDQQCAQTLGWDSDPNLDIQFWLELLSSGWELRFCLYLQCAEVSHYFMMQHNYLFKAIVPYLCHTDLISAYGSLNGGGLGSAGFMVGLNELRCLFQP